MTTVLVALTVLAAACTSSGSGGAHAEPSPPTDPKTHWNVAASKTLTDLVAEVGAKLPGECADWGLYGEAEFLPNSRRVYKFAAPDAVGRCKILTDDVDLAGFTTHAAALDWAKTHGRVLCKVAARAKAVLPGIAWTIGPRWTAQPDAEGVARKLAATVTGGKFLFTACPGPQGKSWVDESVAHTSEIAGTLHGAGLGCTDFLLEDRDVMFGNRHYAVDGLPGAFGQCSITGAQRAIIESFKGTKLDPAKYVTAELAYVCLQLPNAQALVLPKGLVILPDTNNDAAAAAALGVSAPAQACAPK
jgi:hypothetical protein